MRTIDYGMSIVCIAVLLHTSIIFWPFFLLIFTACSSICVLSVVTGLCRHCSHHPHHFVLLLWGLPPLMGVVAHQPPQPCDYGCGRGMALLENWAQGHSHHWWDCGEQREREEMMIGVAVRNRRCLQALNKSTRNSCTQDGHWSGSMMVTFIIHKIWL